MANRVELIAVFILSIFGMSYGADTDTDIQTITAAMRQNENRINSIRLEYTCKTSIDELNGSEAELYHIVKGTFAINKSEGYILLDEKEQKGQVWDKDKEVKGTIRSYNGEVTRYLEHRKNKRGDHQAAIYTDHNLKLYKTNENPYYYVWRPNYAHNTFSDILSDPNSRVKILGEDFVDGLKSIRINYIEFKGVVDCHLWLLPDRNYLPIKSIVYNKNYREGKYPMVVTHWGEFKELNAGIWYPMSIVKYIRNANEPITIKVDNCNIAPLTKKDFEFEFPESAHVTDHTIGLLPTLIGKNAPELCAVKGWINSKPLQLSNLKGKVVLLEFWGYWCGACVAGMPIMIELYEEFGKEGLVVIGIHDDSLESTLELQAKLSDIATERLNGKRIPFPIVLDGGGETTIQGMDTKVWGCTTAAYGITRWPTQLLIDEDGKLVGEFSPYRKEDIRKLIEMLEVSKDRNKRQGN